MKRLTILLAGICLLAATTVPVMRAVAEPGVVTNDNLNQMIRNAKTPSDHEMIAEYYDTERPLRTRKLRNFTASR